MENFCYYKSKVKKNGKYKLIDDLWESHGHGAVSATDAGEWKSQDRTEWFSYMFH